MANPNQLFHNLNILHFKIYLKKLQHIAGIIGHNTLFPGKWKGREESSKNKI